MEVRLVLLYHTEEFLKRYIDWVAVLITYTSTCPTAEQTMNGHLCSSRLLHVFVLTSKVRKETNVRTRSMNIKGFPNYVTGISAEVHVLYSYIYVQSTPNST